MQPPFPTTNDDISIIVSGQWKNSCPKVDYFHFSVGNNIFIQGTISDAAPICLQVITPRSITVKIGKLPAGTYIVNVNIQGGPWSVVGTKVFQVTAAGDGDVRFQGTVTKDESQPGVPICYGDYFITVTVDQILSDPADLLQGVSSVEVCYKNPLGLKAGEKVEVYGHYWKLFGPMQYVGRVQASGDSYYIKRIVTLVCDPGPQTPGVYLATGGRFYATGADDKRDDWGGGWGGVDGFALITIPNVPTTWGAAYQASIWHTGDWVIYHFMTGGGPVGRIDLCLSNYLTPPGGTPVEVYVRTDGLYLPPEHDADLGPPAWTLVGTVNILPPGLWQIYPVTITTPIPPATQYTIGLKCPNCEPEGRFDSNVDIAWIKLVELAR